jgi:hypothetical protein
MGLTPEELRDVLARAEEIQSSSRRGPEMSIELESVISAAEEVGLTRSAVERALRERLDLPAVPPAAGSLVFAQSADGKLYAAEVLSVAPEQVRVRFLRGSEHEVPPDQVRPATLIPGERVTCNWPMWGAWTGTVVGYDSAKRRVKLNDGWGYTRTFPLAEVWLTHPRKAEGPGGSRNRVYLTLMGTGAAIGALLGSLVTFLLLR